MKPAPSLRDALAARALAEIPKLLTLQDRTPVSPTYGCFDRAYWHYRMMDFPCGMSQEFVFPLALAWSLDLPDNPYKGQATIRDWVEAGIRYAARSAHADGSCDDYYPFERAAGAAAFSLLACLEAAQIIGLADDAEVDAFFDKRARWLADHQESGQLSNHEALIVSCLIRMSERYGRQWEEPLARRVERLKSWQHQEGWFSEYGGADPGYLSLTIGLLADSDRRRPDLGLRTPCANAIRFIGQLLHPDGTIGGEYTSRATLNFFPHGFEIAASWMPEALAVNDLALQPLARGDQPCFSDDHIVGHHLWSWMLTWAEWNPQRPGPLTLPAGRTHFTDAQILIDQRGESRLHVGLSRGGAFRLYAGKRLPHSDTGVTLRLRSGRTAVCHLPGGTWDVGEDSLVFQGQMAWSKTARLTPFKSVILRSIMMTGGRFFPDLIRRLLQKILVTGRSDAPFRYKRTVHWNGTNWSVRDEITADGGWGDVAEIGIGGFQTSVTTIMARVWQSGQFQPWIDLSDQLSQAQDGQPIIVERAL